MGKIRVYNKLTGETGLVSEQYYNPTKYTRVDASVPSVSGAATPSAAPSGGGFDIKSLLPYISDVGGAVGGMLGNGGGIVGRMAGATAGAGLGQQAEESLQGKPGDLLSALSFIPGVGAARGFREASQGSQGKSENTSVEDAMKEAMLAQATGEGVGAGMRGIFRLIKEGIPGILDKVVADQAAKSLKTVPLEKVAGRFNTEVLPARSIPGQVEDVANAGRKIITDMSPPDLGGGTELTMKRLNELRKLFNKAWSETGIVGDLQKGMGGIVRDELKQNVPAAKVLLPLSKLLGYDIPDVINSLPLGRTAGKLMNIPMSGVRAVTPSAQGTLSTLLTKYLLPAYFQLLQPDQNKNIQEGEIVK